MKQIIKCTFITATICLVLSNVVAQETQKKKAGVIDKTGNFVVFPQYDDIWSINDEGLMIVLKGGKYGAVDKSGKEVIPPCYDEPFYFHEGIAVVRRNGTCGIIDKNGKEIVQSHYKNVFEFSQGLAVVVDDCEKMDDNYHDDCMCCKMGFIGRAGKEIVPPRYDLVHSFSEGFAAVANIKDTDDYCVSISLNNDSRGCKWGFIDKTGKEVVSLQYDFVGSFEDGLAPVRKNGMWGLLDKTGREVVPPRYDYNPYVEDIIRFYEGLAIVKKDGKYGVIDKTGKEVVPPKYDYVEDFQEGLACVRLGEKYGVIDETGKEVVPPKYDYVKDFQEGLACVRLGEKYGVIDETGKEVVPPKYDYVKDFQEGLAAVQKGYKVGFIDKTGAVVIPLQYEYGDEMIWPKSFNFHEEFASVKRGNKWGFIDKTGKEIVPPIFVEAESFKEGLAVVYVNSEEIALFEKNYNRVQQTWAECKNKLHNCPYNTGKIQFDSALSISFFLNPRLESITDSIVSEIKRKTSDLMDYCVLFENCDNKIQSTWKECNQQLMDYPYNVEKLQLEPVSITNFFLDPRLDAITDSIVSDLKQKSSELLVECYNNLKTKKPKVFSEIYLEQHPEAKSVLENLKLECRCNNYSEAELVVRIADNNIPKCTCRSDYWNQYGNLFSSRTEFDNTYNTSEQGFLDDVKLRQSLKADIQDIASMLSGLKTPKFKDGLTGKNEDIIKLLQKVQYHKGKYYYDEVVDMMFAADASMTKEWEKNGSLFSSRNEFYETYVSGEYKNVLKEKKSK